MENYRWSSLYFADLRFTMSTSGFLMCITASAGAGYFAKENAAYLRKYFDLLSPPQIAAGYGLFWIALFASLAISFLMANVLHAHSRKTKYGFIAVGLTCGLTILLGAWMAMNFAEDIIPETKDVLLYNIRNYQSLAKSTRAIDAIQKEFLCCGVYNYTDWRYNEKFECASYMEPLKCGIPKSCCIENTTAVNDMFCGHERAMMKTAISQNRILPHVDIQMSEPVVMYTKGCLIKFLRVISSGSVKMAIYTTIVLFSQAISIIIAVKLCYNIRKLCARVNRNDNVDDSIELSDREGQHQPLNNIDPASFGRGSANETEFAAESHPNELNPILEPNPAISFDQGASGLMQFHCTNSDDVFPISGNWERLENEVSDSSEQSNTDNVTAMEFVTEPHETEPQSNELNLIPEPNPETSFDGDSLDMIQYDATNSPRSGHMLPTSKNWITFEKELREEDGTQQFNPGDITQFSIPHPLMAYSYPSEDGNMDAVEM